MSSSVSVPKLILQVDDLNHRGAQLFFDSVHPTHVLRDAIASCYSWLYTPAMVPTDVEHLTLVLRAMDGVAHTCGDSNAKEIHLSLDYIVRSETRAKAEITGVIYHEVVHCFQYDGQGKTPGGLIEGIADYVRLRAGYAPPHWRRRIDGEWDAGYETTAYFLDWLECRKEGTVRELNSLLRTEYTETIFQKVAGDDVDTLWRAYCAEYASASPTGPSQPLPTHATVVRN